jgi:CBS domain-containing protein
MVNVKVEEFLAKAAAEPVELTVAELLAIWGYRARTYESVARIQHDLSASGLQCEPAIDEGASDSVVRVGQPAVPPEFDSVGSATGPDQADVDAEVGGGDGWHDALVLPPAALLVSEIPSATAGVVSVRPEQTLSAAQALMSARDYSQLAVLVDDRELKGAVSWRSIAHARLSKAQITLADATWRAPFVYAGDELLKQIDVIWKADFVFVRAEDERVCGIVTTSDLTAAFRDLATPFFQLGEIERRLRRCIDRAFSPDELRAATGSKKLQSAADMVFGQYKQLLSDESRWLRMGWCEVDCMTFIEYLEAARKVRNRVMHFGEELKQEDKDKLDHCLNFVRALDPLP